MTVPGDLVDQVVTRYLAENPEVDRVRMTDPHIHATVHVVVESLRHVDSVLRAWRVREVERRFMVHSTLEASFGSPEGRLGAELLACSVDAPLPDGLRIELDDGTTMVLVNGKWTLTPTESAGSVVPDTTDNHEET